MLKLAKMIQKHVLNNLKDITSEFQKLDNYEEGITSRDIKTVFDRVDFSLSQQEADDIVIFFRCRKDRNNHLSFKELLKAIKDEDFTSTSKAKKKVNQKVQSLLVKIKEALEDKDEDLKNVLEPLAKSGSNLIEVDDLLDELKEVSIKFLLL